MAFVLANIEIILSAVGLLVIVLVPALVDPKQENFWEVMTITAILVGLIHGFIFWLVRRRQRIVRAQLLNDLRTVLADVVNNQLIAVRLNAQKISSTSDRFTDLEGHLRMVDESAKTISTMSTYFRKSRYENGKLNMMSKLRLLLNLRCPPSTSMLNLNRQGL